MNSDVIASKAIAQFNRLPKKGKPNVSREWTTMSAILLHKYTNESSDDNLKVISIGTGTKCLGQNELSRSGDVVSDSHAEVIARRSFLLFVYEQIELCKRGHSDKSILEFKNTSNDKVLFGNLKLREGISFHMFISHLPCGDAAIIEKVSDKVETKKDLSTHNQSRDPGDLSPPTKKTKIELGDAEVVENSQEHRTGAKLQAGPLQFEELQVTGRCRVKPGKGDPTLCMSCSDKLAKWQILGLQGALLSLFIEEPLRLKSITIGGNVPFSKESLERALYTRFNDSVSKALTDSPMLEGYQCPEMYQSESNFMKFSDSLTPAPASISWYLSHAVLDPTEAVQVIINGRKQGTTKKFIGKPSSMVDICRAKIHARYKTLADSVNDMDESVNYNDAKSNSNLYSSRWRTLKENVLTGWTEKPKELKLFK